METQQKIPATGSETAGAVRAHASGKAPAARIGVLAAAAAAGLGLLLWAERRRALRERAVGVEGHEAERVATNLAIAGLSAAAIELTMAPVVEPLSAWAERSRTGLVQHLRVADWARDAIAVVLLDYTLYWWHVVEHRVPLLYRFHQVHHADLELDTTTALRFHFGELLASVPWRAAQIAIIGAGPRAVRVWQRLTMLSVLFHHSNARLPLWLERRLANVVMTPRLHGIHHSIVPEEQDSNWSSGLTLWDRLHGTYRANVPQAAIEIGVAARRSPADVTLARSLAMPFETLPAPLLPDGRAPTAHGTDAPRDVLAG